MPQPKYSAAMIEKTSYPVLINLNLYRFPGTKVKLALAPPVHGIELFVDPLQSKTFNPLIRPFSGTGSLPSVFSALA